VAFESERIESRTPALAKFAAARPFALQALPPASDERAAQSGGFVPEAVSRCLCGLFALRSPRFTPKEICQPELFLQSSQQIQQFPLVFSIVRVTHKSFFNSVLKS
jgi:hypothetical protein